MNIGLIAKDLREKLIITLKRFPFAVFYLLLLNFVVVGEINDWTEDWLDELKFFCVWGCSVGILLSISLKLWHESCQLKNLYKNSIFGGIQFVHILTSFILAFCLNDDLSIIHGFGMAAGVVMVCISLYTLPFFKQKDDLPHWGFIIALCQSLGIALLSGIIMCAGIWLLILSFEHLFGLDIYDDFKLSTTILCFLLLSPTIFMSFIPFGEEKFKSNVTLSNVALKITHYLILPLLGLYILVLYLYALKILFTWNLPNGWVSWLVTASMACVIFIEFLIYPKLYEEDNQFDKTLLRVLPIIIMPLLALMTMGIIRR